MNRTNHPPKSNYFKPGEERANIYSGRKKISENLIREMLKEHGQKAFNVIVEAMTCPNSPILVRTRAAESFLRHTLIQVKVSDSDESQESPKAYGILIKDIMQELIKSEVPLDTLKVLSGIFEQLQEKKKQEAEEAEEARALRDSESNESS